MTAIPRTAEEIIEHILTCRNRLILKDRPLLVAIQGPQGSGKSYLSGLVQKQLTSTPHSLNIAVLSIDDLYLPHSGLAALSESCPLNSLWRGRGQPGTHDIQLGVQVLSALINGNESVELPRFEKSLFNGEGDRLPMDGTGPTVKPPVDVIILEGWCTGFFPISNEELDRRWNGVWRTERALLGLGDEEYGRRSDIRDVNEKLKEYLQFWDLFHVFVQLKPMAPEDDKVSQYGVVFKWRLGQEHAMKVRNGGKGMSDEGVKLFVNRYVPGYVFFGDGPAKGAIGLPEQPKPSWLGQSIRLTLNENRDLVNIELF